MVRIERSLDMKKILLLAICVVIIILESLPFGAVLRFATPPSTDDLTYNVHQPEQFFSYFDPITYGYANFGPLITAILTVVLLALLILYCIKSRGLIAIRIISALAALTSLLPLIMFGTSYFTIIGGCITALLIAEFVATFVRGERK